MKVAVLGTGLIGGSAALGLQHAGHSVVGWDPSDRIRTDAAARGISMAASQSDAIGGADVILLAGPAASIETTLGELDTDALITDVAGVKDPIVRAGSTLRFVGGHPMAGREAPGVVNASPALFRGAAWVIVPDGASSEDVEVVRSLVTDLGAVPIEMTAEAHDAAVAIVSHVPHLLAAALLDAGQRASAFPLAAGSFRDLTRVASSDPASIAEVISMNLTNVTTALRSMADRLEVFVEDPGSAMERAKGLRQELTPPVSSVEVAIDDRPGQIGLVGRAVEASAVDVRDFQLRHGRHGGGGVVTIAVAPEERTDLVEALRAVGLWVLGESSAEKLEQ